MIGGKDIVLNNPHEPGFALGEVFSRALRVWPQATVEDADTGQVLNPADETAFAGLREIMIYKDRYARDSWERSGAVPANANTMVHIIIDWNGTLTLVVENEDDAELKSIIHAVKRFLLPVAKSQT